EHQRQDRQEGVQARQAEQGGSGCELGGRAHRHRRDRQEADPEGLPRPLVLHARRDRPVELRRPAAHRCLPHALVQAEHERGHLRGLLRAVPRAAHVRGLRLDARHLVRRARRPADAPDAPLGGDDLHRLDDGAPAARLLHRRPPQAARAQLGHRLPPAAARHARGLHRLLPARRPALGHRPPRRRRLPQGHPGRGHLHVV
ncbi:MAG: Ubiquinol-cytochrome C reductase, cytochrome B subunit, partial [uncultured Nocardioidaceae bacterium]